MKDPTEITVTRDGLAWREGKVLGRKPWVVKTETQVTITNTTVIKAIDQEEAEEKAIDMANSRAKRIDSSAYTEVVGIYSDF
jgi:hypothetical protein